jgi:hypothetical protein
MTLTIVTATWVPSGARVCEGLVAELYRGPDPKQAEARAEAMLCWARESTCGGVVLVDTFRDDEVLWQHAQPHRPHRLNPRPEPLAVLGHGYPPHVACGKPLLPLQMVGRPPRGLTLFCSVCHVEVRVAQSDHERAMLAALAEGMPQQPRLDVLPACAPGEPPPADETVEQLDLDLSPFGGSGTVGRVAADEGRHGHLIDLDRRRNVSRRAALSPARRKHDEGGST